MEAAIAGLNFGVITPMAMLLLAMWLVLTGRIVPKQTMDDALDAAKLSEQARMELTQQVAELMEHAKTTNHLLRSLPNLRDEEVDAP